MRVGELIKRLKALPEGAEIDADVFGNDRVAAIVGVIQVVPGLYYLGIDDHKEQEERKKRYEEQRQVFKEFEEDQDGAV